ncbi:MAG: tRNA (adenosine(37)-N6)-threonylcarbamoyltransferase complex ATPase subunit type 1 TsaE [candidate division WOR-3 bacterium]
MKIITNSPLETFELGKKVGENIKAPISLLIEGSLGSGKTTFIRGVLSYFGYDIVRSPSFLYVYEYKIPEGKIYHLDLYRIEIEDIDKKLNLSEIMDEKSIFLVEWPFKVRNLNFPNSYEVKINVISDTKREFISDFFKFIKI